MSTSMSPSSFSIFLFPQLVYRLRYANARYDRIALQCRRSRNPTHHARRRAYWAGLRIDTSKARTAWSCSSPIERLSLMPTPPLSALHETSGSPTWEIEAKEEEEAEKQDGLVKLTLTPVADDDYLRQEQAPYACLSPIGLDLELRCSLDGGWNVDNSKAGMDSSDLPVPGAPRWHPIPLPDEEGASDLPMCDDDVACRDTSGSDVLSLGYASYGHDNSALASPRLLRGRLGDVETDGESLI